MNLSLIVKAENIKIDKSKSYRVYTVNVHSDENQIFAQDLECW